MINWMDLTEVILGLPKGQWLHVVPSPLDPIENRRPTKRAVDRWVRGAFFELFRGFEFFPFQRRVSALPPATNASRWAVEQ